ASWYWCAYTTLFRSEAVRHQEVRRRLLPDGLRGRQEAAPGRLVRRGRRQRPRRAARAGPEDRQGEVDPEVRQGLAHLPRLLRRPGGHLQDRKSTRLNSSHVKIS